MVSIPSVRVRMKEQSDFDSALGFLIGKCFAKRMIKKEKGLLF